MTFLNNWGFFAETVFLCLRSLTGPKLKTELVSEIAKKTTRDLPFVFLSSFAEIHCKKLQPEKIKLALYYGDRSFMASGKRNEYLFWKLKPQKTIYICRFFVGQVIRLGNYSGDYSVRKRPRRPTYVVQRPYQEDLIRRRRPRDLSRGLSTCSERLPGCK